MAIAVNSSHQRVVQRPAWVRRRGTEPDAALAALMLVMLLGGVGVLMAALTSSSPVASVSLRSWLQRASSPRPVEGTTQPQESVLQQNVTDGSTASLSVATPGSQAEPAAQADAAAPASESKPAPAPQPATNGAALTVGKAARIAHTDGLGVVFHAAPSRDARIPAGLLEGTSVTILELAGSDWARVQTEARRTGWVPTAFLAAND